MEEQTTRTAMNEGVENQSTRNAGNSGSGSKIGLIIAASILILAGLVWLFIHLGPETTGEIRDIMVIIFALESVITVTAVVILCVNVSKLVNFLKYEIQPILKTTQKTAKRFSGTVSFLCDNAVEPTINAASTVSGIKNAASGFLSLFKK